METDARLPTDLGDLARDGRWTTDPVASRHEAGRFLVTAAEGSDAWRHTSYGFVHDDEHALLVPAPGAFGLEVSFVADLGEQFDQAGLFLRASADEWVKAGVEFADGALQLGAVVTHGTSDWSVAPVPEWRGRVVTVRASRAGDAVTVRARVDDEDWRLVRLAFWRPDLDTEAGLFCAAPTRAGLSVAFTGARFTPPDAALH